VKITDEIFRQNYSCKTVVAHRLPPVRDGTFPLGEAFGVFSGSGLPPHYDKDSVDAQLTSLVGRTVFAANDVVSAWAMLYAAISGHHLPFVGALFDRWAREALQREKLTLLAKEFLRRLPRELAQVESLLAKAHELAHEHELLVIQPWSLRNLEDLTTQTWPLVERSDAAIERETQFDWLLCELQHLRRDIIQVVEEFRQSRDIEKVRVLNQSAVVAAEFKFTRKARRSKSGPRHKEWHQALDA
jgi:hypothetical protein